LASNWRVALPPTGAEREEGVVEGFPPRGLPEPQRRPEHVGLGLGVGPVEVAQDPHEVGGGAVRDAGAHAAAEAAAGVDVLLDEGDALPDVYGEAGEDGLALVVGEVVGQAVEGDDVAVDGHGSPPVAGMHR
jgi:hypothetical protein